MAPTSAMPPTPDGAGGTGGNNNGNSANGGDDNSGDNSRNGGIAMGDNGNGAPGGTVCSLLQLVNCNPEKCLIRQQKLQRLFATAALLLTALLLYSVHDTVISSSKLLACG